MAKYSVMSVDRALSTAIDISQIVSFIFSESRVPVFISMILSATFSTVFVKMHFRSRI